MTDDPIRTGQPVDTPADDDRPLRGRGKPDLVDLAATVPVPVEDALDALERTPGPPDAPPVDRESPPPLAEILGRLPEPEVAGLIVASMTDDEVRALAEAQGRWEMRDHRADWEAAALGEMLEEERETNARAEAERENERADDERRPGDADRRP